MSGGSLDYAYCNVENAASRIPDRTPLYTAFKAHLLKVAKALHDIEWVLSYDYSEGDEIEAIRAVVTRTEELEAARAGILEAIRVGQQALDSLGERPQSTETQRKGGVASK